MEESSRVDNKGVVSSLRPTPYPPFFDGPRCPFLSDPSVPGLNEYETITEKKGKLILDVRERASSRRPEGWIVSGLTSPEPRGFGSRSSFDLGPVVVVFSSFPLTGGGSRL